MTAIQDSPTKDPDKRTRTDLTESHLKVLAAALTAVTALVGLTATFFGINWKQSEKNESAALGKADASSALIEKLKRENTDLQNRLTAAQEALDQAKSSPSASADAPTEDVVYLDELSPNGSDFKSAPATVRGVSYEHALTTPVGCEGFYSAQQSSTDYAISAKKLVRFRADVMLSDDVGDLTVLDFYVRINGETVKQGSVEPGKAVTIDRTVKAEVRTVTFGFTSDDCPLRRGEGILANARLSRS
jgi:hypothetical protein